MAYLQSAIQAFPPIIRLLAASPIYETPPWGVTDQPNFLNQVVKATTLADPRTLLAYVKGIEKKLGRVKTIQYGPREIDVDILFYDEIIYQDEMLSIPHPHLHERAFVLVPLADLAPDFCHPVLGQPVSYLLSQVDTTGIIRYSNAVNLQGNPYENSD